MMYFSCLPLLQPDSVVKIWSRSTDTDSFSRWLLWLILLQEMDSTILLIPYNGLEFALILRISGFTKNP
eukprot:15357771-Ditylum_brightwellii.AAC.2